MSRRPDVRVTIVVLLVGAAASCKNGVTEPRVPGVTVVTGSGVTDTIESRLPQALTVEVRGAGGRPQAGMVVRFASLRFDDHPSSPYNAFVNRLDEPFDFGRTFIVDTTDSRGRASALVQLGTRAGPGRIEVSVPELGAADTATYTVRAGAFVRVVTLPADTVLYPGRSFVLRASGADRFSNPRQEAVTVTHVSGPVTVQGNTVTGTGYGMARVSAAVGALSDTTNITIVPQGVIAVSLRDAGVATMNLDGSGFKVLTTLRSSWVRWAPDGSAITFDNDYAVPARIVTTAGAVRPVRQSSAGTEAEMYPVFAPNGAWVYLSVITNGAFKLWRARPNGTEAAPLATSTPADDFYPTPSPDGTRLMYINRFGGGRDTLRVLDLATGAVTRINVPGHSPSWSPLGDRVAYIDIPAGYVIKTMRPDGTDRRQVSPSGGYEKSVHWSPDAQWLIAYHLQSDSVHLIEVATGLLLSLRYGIPLQSPSWKP